MSVNLLGLIAGLKKDRLSAKRYCKSVCWVILGIMIYVFLDGFEGQNDSKMIMKEEFRFEDIGYNIRNHGIVENVEGIETIYNENEEKYQENVI